MKFLKEANYLLNKKTIDWKLLVFLILVLNVKLAIKVLAIVILLVLERKKIDIANLKKNSIFWFYSLLIAISFLNLFITKGYISVSYILLWGIGTSYWLLMGLASVCLFSKIKNTAYDIISNTITVFLILNVFISFAQLILIMVETGTINPYTYQGFYQKYFINTGDFIRGISFDTSTTNALINSFGIFFFLYRRKHLFAIICVTSLLLSGSNVTNLLVLNTLTFCFIFYSDRLQKSMILLIIACFVIFMSKVSPQNSDYLFNKIGGILNKKTDTAGAPVIATNIRLMPDSLLSPDEQKIKLATIYMDSISIKKQNDTGDPGSKEIQQIKKVVVPTKNPYTPFYERKKDSTEKQKQFAKLSTNKSVADSISVVTMPKKELNGAGKIVAGKLLFSFLEKNPQKIISGAGLGNFSSKLAFKASGESIAGGYIEKYKYLHPDFTTYHFKLYSTYFAKDEGDHSVINTPNSVYYQLLGEYGAIGFFSFIVFYLFYLIRKLKKKSFGLPIVLVLCGAFMFDYWFEHLSIVILFELILFTDILHLQQKKYEINDDE